MPSSNLEALENRVLVPIPAAGTEYGAIHHGRVPIVREGTSHSDGWLMAGFDESCSSLDRIVKTKCQYEFDGRSQPALACADVITGNAFFMAVGFVSF